MKQKEHWMNTVCVCVMGNNFINLKLKIELSKWKSVWMFLVLGLAMTIVEVVSPIVFMCHCKMWQWYYSYLDFHPHQQKKHTQNSREPNKISEKLYCGLMVSSSLIGLRALNQIRHSLNFAQLMPHAWGRISPHKLCGISIICSTQMWKVFSSLSTQSRLYSSYVQCISNHIESNLDSFRIIRKCSHKLIKMKMKFCYNRLVWW